MKGKNIFDIIKFDEKGLIPVIAQDVSSKEVLMMAFMNEEALKITLKTKLAYYFSRSRQKLWQKGETSGQIQEVKEVLIDCDGDALIIKIEQKGEPVQVSCHTGRKSCFFRNVDENGDLEINQEILITKEELYGKK
jgi:phosphoribosyl-AMP cyclohydrolase